MKDSPIMVENKIRVKYILLAIYFAFGSLQFLTLGGVGIVRYLNIIVLILFSIPIIRGKEKIILKKQFILLILFIIYLGITMLWSKDLSRVLNSAIMYTLMFITYILVTNQKPNFKEIKLILMIIACLSTIIATLITFDISTYDIAGRKTLLILGKSADPNFLSINIIFSIICTLNLIMKKYYCKILIIVSLIIQLFSIIKMGSRNAMVCLTIAITIYFFYSIKNNSKDLLKFIMIIMIGIIVIYIGLSTLPDNIIQRLNIYEAIDNGANGRFGIWRRALDIQLDSVFRLIFGFGAGQMPILIDYAHNFYIELLFEYGVIGLVIMSLFIFNSYLMSKKDSFKKSLLVYMLIASMTLSTDRSTLFWNILIVINIFDERSFINGN